MTIKLKIDTDINEENLGLYGLQGNKKNYRTQGTGGRGTNVEISAFVSQN